ncbi:dsDNA binding protein late transcription [Klebsiella phage CPRSA]|nr:dsDNA binding protein late transcription [Klebsiella phage CPRSA]
MSVEFLQTNPDVAKQVKELIKEASNVKTQVENLQRYVQGYLNPKQKLISVSMEKPSGNCSNCITNRPVPLSKKKTTN